MDGMELKTRRKRMGLTQPQLAKKLGVTVRGLCNWEVGKRNTQWKILELAMDRLEDIATTERLKELKAELAELEGRSA